MQVCVKVVRDAPANVQFHHPFRPEYPHDPVNRAVQGQLREAAFFPGKIYPHIPARPQAAHRASAPQPAGDTAPQPVRRMCVMAAS